MLSSKTFVKKTRRGAVLKVVREHYLRDDIACGVKGCAVCYKSTGTSRDADGGPILDPPTPSICSACPAPHLLLPDTNVALHQLDVLEDEVVRDVVLLQTVLQEAKHRSVTAHKRCVRVCVCVCVCACVCVRVCVCGVCACQCTTHSPPTLPSASRPTLCAAGYETLSPCHRSTSMCWPMST